VAQYRAFRVSFGINQYNIQKLAYATFLGISLYFGLRYPMQNSLFNQTENLLPYRGEAYLYPNFFSSAECVAYFKDLHNNIDWKQEPVKIFGKQVMQPRLTAWYGDNDKPYSYSGITMRPKPWTPTLQLIKEKIEMVAKGRFTSALLNLYRDGKDSMGWHRDNEKELGINPVIGSVSFGAARIFKLRDYNDKSVIKQMELSDGSFLLMRGETQHYWEHQVAKTSKEVGMRINITFRAIK
jgi:alkylated DNA repair dioxygenase AlkB